MKNMDTKILTKLAMLIALTTVMTMVIHIPTIGTNGYLNLGDMVVFLSAMMLGRKGGFIVGGLGSSLADSITWLYPLCSYYLYSKRLRRIYSRKIIRNKIRQKNAHNCHSPRRYMDGLWILLC